MSMKNYCHVPIKLYLQKQRVDLIGSLGLYYLQTSVSKQKEDLESSLSQLGPSSQTMSFFFFFNKNLFIFYNLKNIET